MTCSCGDPAYHCGYCDAHKVVPQLARDCEAKHEREADAREVA